MTTTARTGAGRHTRARDRTARRTLLLDLLDRLHRLTPAETALLVDYTRAELAASDALRSSLVGVERALQQRSEQLVAAEAAIVEIEHDRDQAEAAIERVRKALHAIRLEVGRHPGNGAPEALGYRLGLAAADRQLHAALDLQELQP
ncbi:hypothetical protein ACFY7C_12090 [Streptomyces sp. NPDC012769]|uniref:hypothetical protein n=1 Tax=Streptomyces sp. NPDC012769 TaxID=3364848 RepID=UPI00367E7AD6